MKKMILIFVLAMLLIPTAAQAQEEDILPTEGEMSAEPDGFDLMETLIHIGDWWRGGLDTWESICRMSGGTADTHNIVSEIYYNTETEEVCFVYIAHLPDGNTPIPPPIRFDYDPSTDTVVDNTPTMDDIKRTADQIRTGALLDGGAFAQCMFYVVRTAGHDVGSNLLDDAAFSTLCMAFWGVHGAKAAKDIAFRLSIALDVAAHDDSYDPAQTITFAALAQRMRAWWSTL